MSNTSIRDTFFEECEELLEALVEGLSAIEAAPDSIDDINAVFRAVHSIKGGAGAFGFDRLVHFAHSFETVLDSLRSGDLTATEELIALFHRSGDHLADLVAAERDGTAANDETETALLGALEGYLGDSAGEDDFSFDAVTLDFDTPAPLPDDEAGRARHVFRIDFAPTRHLYENGHEPLLLFDALAELGPLSVEAHHGPLPEFDRFEPSDALLRWTLRLTTEESETVLHDLFEFVEGLCDLQITVEDTLAADPVAPLPPEDDAGDAAAAEDIAPAAQPEPTEQAAAETPAAAKAESRGPKPTLRVDLDRVDRLINTVGELIINQAMVAQRIEELELPTVSRLTNELEAYKLLARDIQEGVMAIRAQPVKPLFQRMSRIVREACDATGKKARLATVGDSTEVDKTVIERLADPLTHMVRNAVDHGLEAPDVRTGKGKEVIGTIRLSAAHRSGSVFIEVSDDGAGLNRERILAKAVDKGLVPAEADLTESEIDNLLFLPGFSTAGTVSNLSGRGVGMDVVKNAVQALGGRVSITSQPEQGTTFTIVLPLTLAVMDGFVVSVADQTMVVPISSIIETMRPTRRELHALGPDSHVVRVRGAYVPIVDVADVLGLGPTAVDDTGGTLLLVSMEPHGQVALRVSAIHDQRQVVIKSLESNYTAIPGISAATILGDGKIALILDPEELIRLARRPGERDDPAFRPALELRHA